MTGFGKAVVEIPNKKITVEIKSLNSKQMDMSVRIPVCFREKELDLRNRITHTLERGKVEVSVTLETIGGEVPVQFNYDLMGGYKVRFDEMAARLGLPEPEDWYSLLLRFPDTIKSDVLPTVDEVEGDALLKAVDMAVEGLMQFRAKEGRKLEEFFTKRIVKIQELLAEVPRYETERVAKIRQKITEGLEKLNNIDYDRSRLEQEMIFYIEKLDVNEEKQRLAQHLSYFLETMAAPQGQGKKLGFISQEIGREINTLGSKSNHAEMQRLVVRMKDELEQIKEQVLNVM